MMTIPEGASCDRCGREDRPLFPGGEDEGWLCDRHAPTLSDFVEAYEEYDGDCVGSFIHEWSQRMGVRA